MCHFSIIESWEQPHVFNDIMCLIDVQQELLVQTMSGPNRDSGFRPIGKGALEGLRLLL